MKRRKAEPQKRFTTEGTENTEDFDLKAFLWSDFLERQYFGIPVQMLFHFIFLLFSVPSVFSVVRKFVQPVFFFPNLASKIGAIRLSTGA